MLHFNEDTRVKLPATIQFLRLGYEYQSLKGARIDFETKIFIDRFKTSLERINKREISNDELFALLAEINTLIKNNDLGKEFYKRLLSSEYQIKLLDFEDFSNNDFAVVNELPFSIKEGTEEGSFRPDINILINGMPLAFLEVKHPNNSGGIQVEFERMINKRLKNDDYKKYFNLLQLISFSNNMEYEDADDDIADEVKAGSFYTTPNGQSTTFSFFREDIKEYHSKYKLKEIDEATVKFVVKDGGYNPDETDTPEFNTNLSDLTPCNRFITSLFDKERLLYMLRYGVMFLTEIKKVHNASTNTNEEIPIKQKHIMRYPQFFATRAIIKRFGEEDKNGIIWHTQGSGKTALSAYSLKVITDYFAKKNVNTRFFFVVDRLDLMTQATTEFTNRGFTVTSVSSKTEFAKELKKPLDEDNDGIGTICVVNIHKLMEESKMPVIENVYNVKVQRIFFVDEAHRSYNIHGEFFKNLMTCDSNGIYIAMTGTPLLTKKERSNLKFGDYIHKYFYDKSIADGYTLRIKKEQIDTAAKAEIKENLDIENQNLDSKDVYESDDYIEGVSKYIERDFRQFRLVNTDNTIGGMIVCRSNDQARKINEWIKNHSKLTSGLVMSDSENNANQNVLNKQHQINFRESGFPDILVVHYMLTTGYDVKRLKKMYLLRGPHAQSLLQTISRVNRPYKSPTGKVYQYGYIVDFVDIEKEYTNTLDAYIKELEADINEDGDDEVSLSGLVVDKEDIKRKLDKLQTELKQFIPTDNIEMFVKMMQYFNKEALIKIRKLLTGVKDCSVEFKLSRAVEYSKLIDDDKVNKYLKAVNDRISFINLSSKVIDTLDIMNNEEVIKVVYEFIKTRITILELGKFMLKEADFDKVKDVLTELQREVQKNKNKKDMKVQKLEELLKKIFDKLQVFDYATIDELSDELRTALEEAKRINEENDRLSQAYGGSFAFVKTLSDAVIETTIDRSDIEAFLKIIYDNIKDTIYDDALIIQGKKGFIDATKVKITVILIKEKLFKKVKDSYDDLLEMLYVNLLLYKESI
ncbi:type I restriction endonuclease [Acholeplasma granularum]|uniref:type I restriction endonuclease n=1 Tax=Acholeplasma granularum TaxID=264635 RepID=UPI00046E775C|nr:type I restriction endonuclease [Acholeplasma granularum]